MNIARFVLATALLLAMVAPANATSPTAATTSPAPASPTVPASAWRAPPSDYRYLPTTPCRETGPPARVYAPCTDQMAAFAEVLEAARRDGKLVLVKFGANWCPSCRALHEQLVGATAGALLDPSGRLGQTYRLIEIATSAILSGRRQTIASGEAVLALLAGDGAPSKVRAIPFLAFVDPARAGAVFVRHVDDLIPRGGVETDRAQLAQVLTEAARHLRNGAPAPVEPGWLGRKLKRLLAQ